jgi:hypothetical protein
MSEQEKPSLVTKLKTVEAPASNLKGMRVLSAGGASPERIATAAQNEQRASTIAGAEHKTVLPAKHVFMCRQAPEMKFKVPVIPGGPAVKKIKFTHGVLYINEDWLAKYILGLCKSAPDFAALVRYTDLEEANRVAAAARRQNQLGGAVPGPVTSMSARVISQVALAERDQQIAALQSADPKASAAMQEALGNDLVLTAAGAGKVENAPGFTPDKSSVKSAEKKAD